MFCTKCGKQIGDYDALCSYCGQENKAIKSPVKQYKHSYETPVAADLAFLFAVLTPLFGLVWSLFAGIYYKTSKYTKMCTIAIWISVVSAVVQMVFFALAFTYVSAFISPMIEPIFGGLSTTISDALIKLFNINVPQ